MPPEIASSVHPIASRTDGIWRLPFGWEWSRLDIACAVNPPRPRLRRSPDAPTSFLPMSGVDEVCGTIKELEMRPYSEVMRGFTYFEEGDVLFAKITPSMQNGKCAVACDLESGVGFGSTEFHVLRPGPRVTSEWVHRFLRRRAFREEAMRHFRGAVGQQRVPEEFMATSLIPVPPNLDTQKEILTRTDSLVTEVHEARTVLVDIRRDTERLMESATEEVLGSFGTTKFGPLVSNCKNGIYKPKHYYGRGYPSARMFNIKDGRVDLEKAPLLEVDDKELRAYGLQPGDILVNRVNSRELVGKTGLVPDGLGPCTFESKNIRIRVVRDLADPTFIVAALNSARVRRQIIERQKPAIGQATINQDDLSALQIPFVEDPKVQSRIVTYLTSVRAEILEMRRLQVQDGEDLDRLEQAILDRAFRGEL